MASIHPEVTTLSESDPWPAEPKMEGVPRQANGPGVWGTVRVPPGGRGGRPKGAGLGGSMPPPPGSTFSPPGAFRRREGELY